MYPVSYPPTLTPVLMERQPTLEPSRSYLQPCGDSSRRSPAVIQIRPCGYGAAAGPLQPVYPQQQPPAPQGPRMSAEGEAVDLVRMQEEFILSCQYPLRRLPEDGYPQYRKGGCLSPPLEAMGRRKPYPSYPKSPVRTWRSHRRTSSKSRSPRRVGQLAGGRADYSPRPGSKSPSTTDNDIIRNK